jgi:hypothetical protein
MTTTAVPPEYRRITRRLDYFGGRSHGYELDGEKCPGVTTIIDKGLPKPGLMDWKGKAVARYVADNLDWLAQRSPEEVYDLAVTHPDRDRNAAMGRGKNIHQLAEDLAKGEVVEPPDELVGPITQLLRFMEDFNVQPVAAEFAVVCRDWRYMGTADLMCRLGKGDLALIDYKTGASGLWPELALQLAAYAWADTYFTNPSGPGFHDELPMPLAPGQPQPVTWITDPETGERYPVDRAEPLPRFDLVAGLWLQDDQYQLCPVDAGPEVWRTFLYCAQVAQFTARPKDELIGLPIAPPVTVGGPQ